MQHNCCCKPWSLTARFIIVELEQSVAPYLFCCMVIPRVVLPDLSRRPRLEPNLRIFDELNATLLESLVGVFKAFMVLRTTRRLGAYVLNHDRK